MIDKSWKGGEGERGVLLYIYTTWTYKDNLCYIILHNISPEIANDSETETFPKFCF